MSLEKHLRTVDTVTRVARKLQLLVKDAPKVGKIITDYSIENAFKNKDLKSQPVITRSRNRLNKNKRK